MATKTITADIDGKERTITADIPDGATPEQIEGAVREYIKANPLDQPAKAATPATPKKGEKGLFGKMGDMFSQDIEAGKGMVKEGVRQAENFADLSTFGMKPFLEHQIPALGKQRKQVEEHTRFSNPSQRMGSNIVQGAELFAPVPGLGKLEAGVKAGRLARTGVRFAKGAIDMGVKTYLQTGSAKEAATSALVSGATATALDPLLSKIGRSIQASTIRPRAVDMRDGFLWKTLDKFKLKGNLEQSFKQVETKLTELRNSRNAMLAPGQGTVNLKVPFDEASNQVLDEALNLKHGGESSKTIDALAALQKDVLDMLSGNANVDIRKAENLKEHLGLMGAWAYGRPDRESQTVEKVANILYLKMKDAIEQSLGKAGPKVKALNKQMQELIPVKNAMLARLPVEERNRMFSLQDIITMIPAVMGEPAALALTGLSMGQKSLRFGNFLNRESSALATGASRVLGLTPRVATPQQ